MENNLRGSNFVLGRMQDNPASIYTKDYTKKQADLTKNSQTLNPFRSSSLSKNFKMTQDQYLTTNRVKYPEWKNHQRASLEEQKSKDLKTHHFNLGNYHGTSETTNKYYHDLKQLPESCKGFSAQKIKMRSHNHDFKEGPVMPLASVYNQEYGEKDLTQTHMPVKNNQARQTNILFGKQQTPMVTSNNMDYSKKQYIPVDKAKIPTSKLVLGTNQTQFKTTNQIYHESLPFYANALPTDTIKQLRATHFNLGGSKPNYSTQSSNYQAHPSANTKPYQPALQRTSKSIAPDGKFYGQTTNQRQFPKRQLLPGNRFKREDFNSGWKLGGNQANTYLTESTSNYGAKIGQRCQVFVPQETLVIGGDRTDYTTTHRANFTKKQIPRKEMGGEQSNIRSHHFNIGQNQGDKYITVYQDQFREDQNNKSKLFHR